MDNQPVLIRFGKFEDIIQRRKERQAMIPDEIEVLPYPMDRINAFRASLYQLMREGRAIAEVLNRGNGAREIALSITNLQQARHWVEDALAELAYKLPIEYRDEA